MSHSFITVTEEANLVIRRLEEHDISVVEAERTDMRSEVKQPQSRPLFVLRLLLLRG